MHGISGMWVSYWGFQGRVTGQVFTRLTGTPQCKNVLSEKLNF